MYVTHNLSPNYALEIEQYQSLAAFCKPPQTCQNIVSTSLSSSAVNAMSSTTQPFLNDSPKLQTIPYPQELPSKLIIKILDLEYIDMAELLPDYWDVKEDGSSRCSHSHCSQCKYPSYSSLVLLLTTRYPHHMGHFMQGSSQYKIIGKGESWFNLYNETLTGREEAISWCVHCSSELHSSAPCPEKPHSTNPRSGEPLVLYVGHFRQRNIQAQDMAFLIAIEGITAHMLPTVNSFTSVQPVQVNSHRTTACVHKPTNEL